MLYTIHNILLILLSAYMLIVYCTYVNTVYTVNNILYNAHILMFNYISKSKRK